MFYSWFSSKKAVEAAVSSGFDFIGVVKTNPKGFCKATIDCLKKEWHGGSYILFISNPMVPGEINPITVGYKYNSC